MTIKEPNWKSWIVETTEPIFTKEQCELICKLGRSRPPQNAQIGIGSAGVYDTKTRTSHISWIPFDGEVATPMYRRLNEIMQQTNRRHFGFENMQITEQAQYTEYPEGGFYDWHMDTDVVMKNEPPVRKISMTLLLNHPSEFEGGDLELMTPGRFKKIEQGHAISFASFINHRVNKVTRGVRQSLVVWFGGTPFR